MLNFQPVSDDTWAGKHILIVEDDTVLGNLLLEALQEETSCPVSLATSGEMALNMLQTVMPALFMLDYQLPGMNGLELAERLRRLEGGERVPIILTSAALPQGNIALYQLTTLQKPFELDILLELIAELLTV
jgi:DNA-binding response OmpR family regulator